jgi:hypothetical protein
MKKSLLIFLVLSISFSLMAQQNKIKEAGLVFRNLDNFGVVYKTGNEFSLWRFSAIGLSGVNTTQTNDVNKAISHNFGANIKIGKEFRHSLSDNFLFSYGADLSFSFSKSYQKTDYDQTAENPVEFDPDSETKDYSPGFNLVFGLNYILNDKIVFGAELLPSIVYSFSNGSSTSEEGAVTKTKYSGYSCGLSTSSVLFTVAYRFH